MSLRSKEFHGCGNETYHHNNASGIVLCNGHVLNSLYVLKFVECWWSIRGVFMGPYHYTGRVLIFWLPTEWCWIIEEFVCYPYKICLFFNWGRSEQRKSVLSRVSGNEAEIRTGSGLLDGGSIKLSIFSASFKGICRVVANRLIEKQFSELWHCAHEVLCSKWYSQYGINTYPWYQDLGTQSGRVLRTYYLTCPGRVGWSFHHYFKQNRQICLLFRIIWRQTLTIYNRHGSQKGGVLICNINTPL